GTTTNFLYDGANAVQELAGGTPSANMLTGLRVDEVFGRTDSLGTRSFVTDALGSTVALTDGSGAVKTNYTYEPYGNTTTSGEVNGNASQYTGRENDGTGLYYYRARYYNPGFGRFVAEDPIGIRGGSNLFSYSMADPIDYADPVGNMTTPGASLVESITGDAAPAGPGAGSACPVPKDGMQIAASTNNENYAAKMLGYDRNEFGDMIHSLKYDSGLRGDDNLLFYDTGDVYFNGEHLGNIHDWAR
ncbi:RHS repeat-associated core domain-containing protein, partial [Trinickia dinghuensis]